MSTHDTYYVPAQSKWPIIATVGLLITVYGLGVWFNDLKAARPESHGRGSFSSVACYWPTCCSAGSAR